MFSYSLAGYGTTRSKKPAKLCGWCLLFKHVELYSVLSVTYKPNRLLYGTVMELIHPTAL